VIRRDDERSVGGHVREIGGVDVDANVERPQRRGREIFVRVALLVQAMESGETR